jgi:hypothetical protein
MTLLAAPPFGGKVQHGAQYQEGDDHKEGNQPAVHECFLSIEWLLGQGLRICFVELQNPTHIKSVSFTVRPGPHIITRKDRTSGHFGGGTGSTSGCFGTPGSGSKTGGSSGVGGSPYGGGLGITTSPALGGHTVSVAFCK